MKWLAIKLILNPLCWYDYRQRVAGLKPDEMYWADYLRLDWGWMAHGMWKRELQTKLFVFRNKIKMLWITFMNLNQD